MTGGSLFDPQSGTLRLTPSALRAMVQVPSDDAEPDPAALDELRGGGIVVEDDRLHPRLVALASCVAAPLSRLTVDHLGEPGWTVDGWIDDKIAVLLRSSGVEQQIAADIIAVPSGMVPLNLAKLVALGPRERVKVGEPVELDEGWLEAVLGSGEAWTPHEIEAGFAKDDEVLPEWLEVLGTLSSRPSRRWRMGAWWNSPEESPAGRLLEVVESDAGSFLLTHHRHPQRRYRRVRLHPLTATQIWTLLCALLPAAEQVDRPLSD